MIKYQNFINKLKLKSKKEVVIFSLSSLICFIIDFIIYSLILTLSNKIILSNIIARGISSITNFSINKNLVFKNKKNLKNQIIKYYILVTIIIILNSIILKLLSLVINPYLSKLITELLLFTLSYLIQKKFIFKASLNTFK